MDGASSTPDFPPTLPRPVCNVVIPCRRIHGAVRTDYENVEFTGIAGDRGDGRTRNDGPREDIPPAAPPTVRLLRIPGSGVCFPIRSGNKYIQLVRIAGDRGHGAP